MVMGAALLLMTAPAAMVDAGQQSDAVSIYPLGDVLDAFATACSGVEDPAVNRASALAAGWAEYRPEPDSRLGIVIDYGRKAVAEEELQPGEEPTELLENGVFRQQVAGRSLHLVLSGARVDTISTYGCRLYDLDATHEPSPAALEDWAVRPANAVQRPANGMVKYVWNPGMKPGHFEMEINYVRPGTQLPIPVPLSGLVLTASAMEIAGL